MKRIYLFNTVAWNYRKKIGFPVCKKENFAGLQAHRKRGKSARASPTPHHTLNEERSACFTAQHLSALGPVARSLVSANRWLRGIKLYRFPWYLTLVSTNHASSNPGLVCSVWFSPSASCCSCFDYFVVIEIAFMDNQAQITEIISRLDSEKVRW